MTFLGFYSSSWLKCSMLALVLIGISHGFSPMGATSLRVALGNSQCDRPYHFSRSFSRSCSKQLSVLTERQMQFWEDVDEGLDDIQAFYESSKGMDINRVRQFVKSASGQIPPPVGTIPGHQLSEEHIDGLTAQPFWDVHNHKDLFPWAAELEANTQVILDELLRAATPTASTESLSPTTEATPNVFSSDSAWQTEVMGTGWSAVRLQRLGVWNTEICRKFFSNTYELLRSLSIPIAVRGVCFARQSPGSGVQPHSDGRNFILTSHLGLSIPEGCWIKAGEELRTWEVGKLTTLDTSFEHSTGNPGDSERLVLIIDFWHPELTEAERAALEFVYDLRNKFESGVIPIRKPRSLQAKDDGIGAFWSKLTGGS